MKTKTTSAIKVMAIELTTNLKTLVKDVGDLNRELAIDAIKSGFHPTGPQYWIYQWTSIDPQADFQLKIALPIAEFGGKLCNNRYKVEILPEFKHLVYEHEGPWDTLENSYGQIMTYIGKNNIQPNGFSRELYINCDFENPINNRTEIQFGIY